MQRISATILIVLYVLIIIIAAYFCGVCFVYPRKYDYEVNKVCEQFDLPLHTFYALINTESRFNPKVVSSKGAVGLTQILPSTAQYICLKNNINYEQYDLYKAEDNLYLGAMYLRYLIDKFPSISTALCAYNAGETVVRSWLNDIRYSYDKISLYNIPYPETRNYINKITNAQKIYKDFYHV